jgi:hypothetical protein
MEKTSLQKVKRMIPRAGSFLLLPFPFNLLFLSSWIYSALAPQPSPFLGSVMNLM